MQAEKRSRNRTQKRVSKYLDSNPTSIFITIITLLVLYGDDFRVILITGD